jgi:hypothetical protein
MLADYQALCNTGINDPEWLRYKWFCKEYPELVERLTQYHIASFLGITPVSLSRLRNKHSK